MVITTTSTLPSRQRKGIEVSTKRTKKRRGKPLLREGPMAELYREMDRVYNGALEVIARHPVVGVGVSDDPDPPRAAYKKAPRLTSAALPEIAAYARTHHDLKLTGLIRAVATEFPKATVGEIRASLPDLNPSTVSIQVGKARKK